MSQVGYIQIVDRVDIWVGVRAEAGLKVGRAGAGGGY